MGIDVIINEGLNKDIVPMFFGHEACKSGHRFGPFIRKHYLIHLCINGKGILKDKYGEHEITAGQLFIIRPDEITVYRADDITPWEYAWIAFSGDMSNVFNTDKSVYHYPKHVGNELLELCTRKEKSPYPYVAILYKIIHYLLNGNEKEKDVVEQIKNYINFNYMNDLSVDKLSFIFSFERSYLYRLFKNKTGVSVKEYITKTRMNQAIVLLEKGYSVSSTAFSVGYKDEFNFSKAFKKRYAISPKNYMKNN